MRLAPLLLLLGGCGLVLETDPPALVTPPPPPCVVAGAETCNAVDDDCDGRVDEDLGQTTCGLGGCAVTVDVCTDGAPAMCMPNPGSDETCNAIDDDCDGEVDEDCRCDAYVLAGGDDGSGDRASPYGTIMEGIGMVSASGGGVVCVGATSNTAGDCLAEYTELVTMADGVDVVGGFRAEGGWPADDTCTTVIRSDLPNAVHFPVGVRVPTSLTRFVVEGADGLDASTAVRVSGGGTLRALEILAGSSLESTAVWLRGADSGRAEIEGGRIVGTSSDVTQSFALRVNGKPARVSGVRTIQAGTALNNFAIWAESVDGLVIEDFGSIVGGDGRTTTGIWLNDAQGVRIERGEEISVGVGMSSSAAVTAAGSDVRITEVLTIRGGGGALADGVIVHAGAHVVLRRIGEVVGRSSGGVTGSDAYAVFCEGMGTQCEIEESGLTALSGGAVGEGTAVGFLAGASGRIFGSRLRTSADAANGHGAVVRNAGPVEIVANEIIMSTARVLQVGIEIEDGEARVINNFVDVADGGNGIEIRFPSLSGEVQVHSNTFASLRPSTTSFDARALVAIGGDGSVGALPAFFRNNIIYCSAASMTLAGVFERSGQPEVFDHNLLHGCRALWSSSDPIMEPSMVADLLISRMYVGNIVDGSDPLLRPDGRLMPMSPAIDAGTTREAPMFDIDGDERSIDPPPDIGCDEWTAP